MSEFNTLLIEMFKRHLEGFEKLVSVTRLTGGASRLTFKVVTICFGEQKIIALRLNPTDLNTDGLMSHRISPLAEAKIMKAARSAGVPAPNITYILDKKDNLGEGYLMEWMDGESVGSKITRAEEFKRIRPTLARQCGTILARIHSIAVPSNGLDHLLETISPEDFVSRQYESYQSLEVQRPMIDYVAQWLMDNPPQSRPLCLVHNDFRNGNFLIDKKQGITGILDWEIAHIGNPIRDIGWLCTKSWRFGVPGKMVGGFGMLEDLLSAYKDASGSEISSKEIKFWTVFGSFWWAVACLLMEKSYENGSDKNLERPIIGRRVSECEVDCAHILIPGKIDRGVLKIRNSKKRNNEESLLLSSVRDFIKSEIIKNSEGRTKFLGQIARNSLDICIREGQFRAEFNHREKTRLKNLLGCEDQLHQLRSQLISAIKTRKIPLEDESLKAHLRETAFSQILIDQPHYPGATDLIKTTF